jgi:hypothetical protein
MLLHNQKQVRSAACIPSSLMFHWLLVLQKRCITNLCRLVQGTCSDMLSFACACVMRGACGEHACAWSYAGCCGHLRQFAVCLGSAKFSNQLANVHSQATDTGTSRLTSNNETSELACCGIQLHCQSTARCRHGLPHCAMQGQ